MSVTVAAPVKYSTEVDLLELLDRTQKKSWMGWGVKLILPAIGFCAVAYAAKTAPLSTIIGLTWQIFDFNKRREEQQKYFRVQSSFQEQSTHAPCVNYENVRIILKERNRRAAYDATAMSTLALALAFSHLNYIGWLGGLAAGRIGGACIQDGVEYISKIGFDPEHYIAHVRSNIFPKRLSLI